MKQYTKKTRNTRRAGFTLIEALAAISIGSVLLGLIAVLLVSSQQLHRRAADRAQGCRARTALFAAFRADVHAAVDVAVAASNSPRTLATLKYRDGRVITYAASADRSGIVRTEMLGDRPIRLETYRIPPKSSIAILRRSDFLVLQVTDIAGRSAPFETIARPDADNVATITIDRKPPR